MENLPRTAAYIAKVSDRQTDLRATSAAVLDGVGECILEIGCGHGHFLNAYAAAQPSKICVGLDIISERIERANRKKDRARLTNLHFLHASAADFLATLPPSTRLSDVFVLFPDPWPKRRHHKNRLMQATFLSDLSKHTSPGARVFFRTDDVNYYAAACAVIDSHPVWEIAPGPWPFEYETVFQQRAAEGFHSLVARQKL